MLYLHQCGYLRKYLNICALFEIFNLINLFAVSPCRCAITSFDLDLFLCGLCELSERNALEVDLYLRVLHALHGKNVIDLSF